MGVASIEKCPAGLDPKWSATWRLTRDELKEAGTFSASMRPLLDEFVFALKGAEDARIGFGWLDALEIYASENESEMEIPDWRALAQISGSLPTQWDKHAKRASALADQLGLSPKAQRSLGKKLEGGKDGKQDTDPFSGLDDEVSAKRQAKAAAG